MTTEVTCARGPGFLDPICRNGDTITAVLTVIAVAALGVATGGLFVTAIGGSAGIAIPLGGGGAAALAGGGIAGGAATGTIVLSPTAAGTLVGSLAGIQTAIVMAQNMNGGDGESPVNRGDLKRVNPPDIQRWFGMDAHALKREILGAGARISRYDIYRIGAEVVLLEKSTSILVRTGYMIPGF